MFTFSVNGEYITPVVFGCYLICVLGWIWFSKGPQHLHPYGRIRSKRRQSNWYEDLLPSHLHIASSWTSSHLRDFIAYLHFTPAARRVQANSNAELASDLPRWAFDKSSTSPLGLFTRVFDTSFAGQIEERAGVLRQGVGQFTR